MRQGACPRPPSVAKTRRPETAHGVTRRKTAGLRANVEDDARKFETQAWARETVFHRLIGQQAERIHDVAKINTRRPDRDFDLILARLQPRKTLPTQVSQLPSYREPHADIALFSGPRCCAVVGPGCCGGSQPWRIA